MDYGPVISDSADYSREALCGNVKTWFVFIICSMPFSLIQFAFDPETLRTAKITDWQDLLPLIPWPQILALCLLGFLLLFVIQGYLARVYRGSAQPPEFDSWVSLYSDGIRITIVETVWLLPAYLLLGIDLVILFMMISTSSNVESVGTMIGLLAAAMIIGLVAVVLMFIGIFFSIIGKVRFARTGSIRKGLQYREINSTIRTIGLGNYIIALLILWAVAFAFNMVVGLLSVIPFLGWAIVLVLNPFIMLFSARYLSRLYDQAAPVVPAAAPGIAL